MKKYVAITVSDTNQVNAQLKLEEKVNKALLTGWRLVGGASLTIATATFYYTQAIVKEVEE